MQPRNSHILASPKPNYVIMEPVEIQEHVLYLVAIYLRGIFTHNQAVDQFFKRPVAENWNVQKTSHGLVVPEKGKKLDWTGLLNTKMQGLESCSETI